RAGEPQHASGAGAAHPGDASSPTLRLREQALEERLPENLLAEAPLERAARGPAPGGEETHGGQQDPACPAGAGVHTHLAGTLTRMSVCRKRGAVCPVCHHPPPAARGLPPTSFTRRTG